MGGTVLGLRQHNGQDLYRSRNFAETGLAGACVASPLIALRLVVAHRLSGCRLTSIEIIRSKPRVGAIPTADSQTEKFVVREGRKRPYPDKGSLTYPPRTLIASYLDRRGYIVLFLFSVPLFSLCLETRNSPPFLHMPLDFKDLQRVGINPDLIALTGADAVPREAVRNTSSRGYYAEKRKRARCLTLSDQILSDQEDRMRMEASHTTLGLSARSYVDSNRPPLQTSIEALDTVLSEIVCHHSSRLGGLRLRTDPYRVWSPIGSGFDAVVVTDRSASALDRLASHIIYRQGF